VTATRVPYSVYWGTFDAGPGNDSVAIQRGGTVLGGEGAESVADVRRRLLRRRGRRLRQHQTGGAFAGGDDADLVTTLDAGIVDGGNGPDHVAILRGGVFNGGPTWTQWEPTKA
jgi:hypothetical protein